MISDYRYVKENQNFIENVDRLGSDLSRLLKASRDAIEQSNKSIVHVIQQLDETRILTRPQPRLKNRDNVLQFPRP